ncbi:Fcf1-domain-containing protein, partial [Chlamydoabsidia padenii]
MRAKTSRLYKKAMHSYCIGFGFHAPYQILLDSSFIKLATEQRLSLQDDLQTLLSSPTRPLVTNCVIHELKKQGDHRAATIAKQFESRKCKHLHPVSSAHCVMELIGSTNGNNYCLATQNDDHRKQVRLMPGIPVLKVQKGMIILEPLTKATKDAIQQIARLIQEPSKVESTDGGPVHKKRKVKGANPLSMKKKK